MFENMPTIVLGNVASVVWETNNWKEFWNRNGMKMQKFI